MLAFSGLMVSIYAAWLARYGDGSSFRPGDIVALNVIRVKIAAFRGRGTRAHDRLDYCVTVFNQRFFFEGKFSNRHRDIAVLVELEFNSSGFHFLDCFCRVFRNGSRLSDSALVRAGQALFRVSALQPLPAASQRRRQNPENLPELFDQILEPTCSAPASFAAFAAAPSAKTSTRTDLPLPCGSAHVPRTIWSDCFGSTPSRNETVTV